MNLPPFIKQINQKLSGLPDIALTALLFSISAIGLVVSLFGSPSLKALFAAWYIAP